MAEVHNNKSCYEKLDETFYDNIAINTEEQLHAAIHPEAQHLDLTDAGETPQPADIVCFNLNRGVSELEDYDIGEDLECRKSVLIRAINPYQVFQSFTR